MKKFKGFLATALLALTVLAVSLSVLACDNNGGENYTLAVDPATVTVTAGENVTLVRYRWGHFWQTVLRRLPCPFV